MATFKRIVHSPFSLGCDGMSSHPIHSTTPFSSTNKKYTFNFLSQKTTYSAIQYRCYHVSKISRRPDGVFGSGVILLETVNLS